MAAALDGRVVKRFLIGRIKRIVCINSGFDLTIVGALCCGGNLLAVGNALISALTEATSLSLSTAMPPFCSAAGCASATAGVMPNASVTERTAAVALASTLFFLKNVFFISFLSSSLALPNTPFAQKKTVMDRHSPGRFNRVQIFLVPSFSITARFSVGNPPWRADVRHVL